MTLTLSKLKSYLIVWSQVKKYFFYVNVNGKFFFAIKGQRKVIFSASVAQLDKQETICCMAESSRHKFESDLRPFATCLLLLVPVQ